MNTASDLQALVAQVKAAECAFARSMAERNPLAFAACLSEQAVFFGRQSVLRGKAAVVQGWRPFFDGASAPCSWVPDAVEVLADGTLAVSTGPVCTAQGHAIARFSSIRRQEAPGQWRVVFDRGQQPDS